MATFSSISTVYVGWRYVLKCKCDLNNSVDRKISFPVCDMYVLLFLLATLVLCRDSRLMAREVNLDHLGFFWLTLSRSRVVWKTESGSQMSFSCGGMKIIAGTTRLAFSMGS